MQGFIKVTTTVVVITIFGLTAVLFLNRSMIFRQSHSSSPYNVALNKPVTVDSTYNNNYLAENAVDGDHESISSRWLSARTNTLDWTEKPHWIEIDLLGNFNISRLKFWSGAEDEYKWPPADFLFQCWENDHWIDVISQSENNDSIFNKDFTPVVTNKVRLFATRGTDIGALRLYDIEVYGYPTN